MTYFAWNISPAILSIGGYELRYYALLFGLGFYLSYRLLAWSFQNEGFSADKAGSLVFYGMIGTMIGARLGHVIFYDPLYYWQHPLEILMTWRGGLASHGGTLGVIIAVWLYRRKNPEFSYLWLADRGVPAIALTAGFIRIGNFFNSEIIGRPTDVPWAVVFERIDPVPRHPAMLYEACAYLILFTTSIYFYRSRRTHLRPGLLLGLLFTWIFSARFFLEFLKEDQAAFEKGMILNMGQILSIPFILLGLILLTGIGQGFLLKKPVAS